MDKTFNIHDLQNILAKGADERIFQDENGFTKYGLNPLEYDIVNRGSCTCSSATKGDIELMLQLLNSNKTDEAWKEELELISSELKRILNRKEQDNFEIFFAPTGTDLVYYNHILARLTNPGKTIVNITTCIEELGSGTRLATEGKYYARYNQFGKEVPFGQPIVKDENIESYFFSARNESGEVQNNSEKIKRIVEDHKNDTVIINLVYGSKSGIEDSLHLMDELKHDNIIWNTDLCQFRHSKKIINQLIQKGSNVMLTGSKFYQSAPFSGALLIPKERYNKAYKATNWNELTNYLSIFSAYDFPKNFRLKHSIESEMNISTILRWKCGLEEINKYNHIDLKQAKEITQRWRAVVKTFLKSDSHFELMPFQSNTNQSIVSFRVLVNGKYLSSEELKSLHQSIVRKNYSNTHNFKTIFIGQPVTYDNNKSFIRLAIGSKNIRKFIEKDEKQFLDDQSILQIILNKVIEIENGNQH